MVPSVVTPVTQKKPKSMTPTFSAAAMCRARCRGSLPFALRRNALAVVAEAIASRSARAAETGTGAGAAAALPAPAVDIGATPGPPAVAAGIVPAAGGPGGGGVAGGASGTGGAGVEALLGVDATGAGPAEPPPMAPPVVAPDAAPDGGAAAAWFTGACVGAGEAAGAGDESGAGGGWLAVGWRGDGFAALVALGVPEPAPLELLLPGAPVALLFAEALGVAEPWAVEADDVPPEVCKLDVGFDDVDKPPPVEGAEGVEPLGTEPVVVLGTGEVGPSAR
jgi:hypothetical protein